MLLSVGVGGSSVGIAALNAGVYLIGFDVLVIVGVPCGAAIILKALLTSDPSAEFEKIILAMVLPFGTSNIV